MINNVVRDVNSNECFLISDLLNGRKTAVEVDSSISPMSGIIICPETGAKLNFVELLIGRREVVDDKYANKYNMYPLSGMIKSVNGEMVNLVELILSSGGSSSSGSPRANAKEIIRLANISSAVINRTQYNFLITIVAPEKGYYFNLDEVELFDYDNTIISFNGRVSINENDQKYAQLNNSEEQDTVVLAKGETHIFTLKNIDEYIMEQERIGEF